MGDQAICELLDDDYSIDDLNPSSKFLQKPQNTSVKGDTIESFVQVNRYN